MSLSISNNYNQYNNSINNQTSNTKRISKEEYFSELTKKYSNVNLYMGTSPVSAANKVSVSVSPQLISKAASNPEEAKKLNYLLDQMEGIKSHINNSKFAPAGSVKSVSFVIDADGGMRCKCEISSGNSSNKKSKINDKEKDDKKDKTDALKEQLEKKQAEAKKLLYNFQQVNYKSDIVKASNYYNQMNFSGYLSQFIKNV